ncbi:MAG: hypothetical protein ACOVOQ_08165 [Flavobacterium sp.]
MTESRTANSTFAIGGVSCSADSLVVAESFVLRINICGKNPAHRKSAKRWEKVSDFFPTSGAFQRKKLFHTFSQLDLCASANAFAKLRWLAAMLQLNGRNFDVFMILLNLYV